MAIELDPQRPLFTPEQARQAYQLHTAGGRLFASDVDNQLHENGIAQIHMPLSSGDFQQLTRVFDDCVDEFPDLLQTTYHTVDDRMNNSAGYVRKEQKINQAQRQIQDPKSLFHFSESARTRWGAQFPHAPRQLRNLFSAGFEAQNALLGIARAHITGLNETHPNIEKLYYSDDRDPHTLSFLRVLSYDGYQPTDDASAVAKPHFDIGGVTIQAYADAPGFWGAKDGPRGERTHYDTADDQAFLFLGTEHRKVYSADSPLEPLWHGVDRIIPEGAKYVTRRHAVILFIDAPHVNHGITEQDTLPHLYGKNVVSIHETAKDSATEVA